MIESDFQKALPRLLNVLEQFTDLQWSLDSSFQLLGRFRRSQQRLSCPSSEGSSCTAIVEEPGDQQFPIFSATPIFQDECVVDNSITLLIDVELLWVFSITYNSTWHCPVLYFTVESATGFLSRTEILQQLGVIDDDCSFVSAEEHPVTGTPTFFLHPCETTEMLKTICPTMDPASCLWAWCSIVFPSVGLLISPMEYVKGRALLIQSH